jgi:Zn-dependent peptidase ImmA (M78 family)/transcriptional regulator with XRE-family HTH domain
MPTSEAFISADVLRWARKRANTTTDRIAKRLNVKPESVASWESGNKRPSYRQAERLAETLHVPLTYLFLSTPPNERVPIADFRTLDNGGLEESADLIDLLNDVLAKHSWYREYVEAEGHKELSFVGSFAPDAPADDIASDIASTLEINDAFRSSCSNWQEFLSKLTDRVQMVGVLVMRSGVVAGNTHRAISPRVFRGFTVSDRLAPLIFINSADFKAAQIFTLAHELSHVWIGKTGISNENLEEPDPSEIEKKCDAVAAQLLVPTNDFIERWSLTRGNLGSLAQHYRVSTLVVLRRARDLEQITGKQFKELFAAERKKYTKPKEGGGNFYYTLLARNSALFTNAVVSAVREGRELYRDAAKLLNVSVNTIPKIAEFLATRPTSE